MERKHPYRPIPDPVEYIKQILRAKATTNSLDSLCNHNENDGVHKICPQQTFKHACLTQLTSALQAVTGVSILPEMHFFLPPYQLVQHSDQSFPIFSRLQNGFQGFVPEDTVQIEQHFPLLVGDIK